MSRQAEPAGPALPSAARPRRVLITGGGGYLGSVLVPLLLERGHRVSVLDCFYFGEESLAAVEQHPALSIIRDDLFHQENISDLLRGVDAVVHLASISNDPSSDLDPNLTIRTNFLASVALARRARQDGVGQFVFSSSCSVYGAAGSALLDEGSPTAPVTIYALSKLESEHELLKLSSQEFGVSVLRLSTLFGISPRMRFDLAVNTMAKRALQGLDIMLNGDGNQYRPFLHVRDASEAIRSVLEADPAITEGEIFNLGGDELNYRIGELCQEVAAAFPEIRISRRPENDDVRSYRVSFAKARERLGFVPRRVIRDGVGEISRAHRDGTFGDMDQDRFYNVLVMKKVHRKGILTPSLASAPRWSSVVGSSAEGGAPIGVSLAAQQFGATVPERRFKVAAMILTYNCAKLLPRAYEKIPRELVDHIFVTDDGSRDGTPEVAERLGIPLIRSSRNRGYGGNVKAGLARALELSADYVLEVHGDGGQFHPAAITQALPHMEEGVDLILGSRFQDPRRALANGMPLIRFAANRFLSFFDRLVLRLPLTEFHTGFRIYGRQMLERIPFEQTSDDYLFSFQIIAQAAYYNLRVLEVPVEADYRSEHTSHKLSGATVYALQTFGVLGAYLLAKRGLYFSKIFPPLPSPLASSP